MDRAENRLQVISMIRDRLPEYSISITAVGTNSIATAAMRRPARILPLRAKTPWLSHHGSADVIIGPLGIVIADGADRRGDG